MGNLATLLIIGIKLEKVSDGQCFILENIQMCNIVKIWY